MTRDELQLVADAIWVTLGPDGYGAIVAEPVQGTISIDVAGYDQETGFMFTWNETIFRLEIEGQRGDERFNYMRHVAKALRAALRGLRTEQIKMSLQPEDS